MVKYEKLLKMGTVVSPEPLRRPNSTHLQSRDAYEELCQRPGGQVGLAGGVVVPHPTTVPILTPSLILSLSSDIPRASSAPQLLL